MKTPELRERFVKFFEHRGHERAPSSELVPANDPTLLFVNAGMVPFKEYFTGKAKPKHPRMVSIQKCVRAGGKHNDLENVGFTARHHTFFEMLGNFSFGDYFKEEAIVWAWEFLTEELNIPKEKLYVTAHHTDQEAAEIWKNKVGVDPSHFFYRGDKDNFWEMGEIGPCGPCSEIFYDHGPEHTNPDADTKTCLLEDEDRYVEIWNLVFMQFEHYKMGDEIDRRPLPNPCIDTGSGLERLAAALQNIYNNYDTDVFRGLIQSISEISGKSYEDEKYTASMRVVADHVRASTMLITDGVLPSNEGRGYVLRRIIRRAVRYLNELGVEKPVLHKLVPVVFADLKSDYPDNFRNKAMAEKFLKVEEESFRKTLKAGLQLLEKEIQRLQKKDKDTLEGEVSFLMYDSHGFPVDLTELILRENGLKLDHKGFEAMMEQQKERSRSSSAFGSRQDKSAEFYKIKENHGATDFTGYDQLQSDAKLLKIVEISEKQSALVFAATPFYAESGGQAGDKGMIFKGSEAISKVIDTIAPVQGIHAHIVESSAALKEGEIYTLSVDRQLRSLTANNHTATHLLHAALRKVLGDHVKQAGSYVGPENLRFDFSHPEAMTKEQLQKVEQLVNEQILKGTNTSTEVLSKDEAVNRGALALFGEKYGDKVRVLFVDDFSVELCGGTHVKNTLQIGSFLITSESSLAAGVRRIEAITNKKAIQKARERMNILDELEFALNAGDDAVVSALRNLQQSLKERDKKIKSLQDKQQAKSAVDLFKDPDPIRDGMVFKAVDVGAEGDLRKLGDLFIDKHKNGVVLITSQKGEKASVLLKTYKGNKTLNCSDLLKDVLAKFGGRGGGKPDMAQGSVESSKIAKVKHEISMAIQ